MALQLGDTAPDFEAQTTEGPIKFPRLDRRLVGGAVLTSEGLHTDLHDRARVHGQHQARVRPPRRQGDRPLGRPARPPRRLGERHRGDAGPRPQLSDHQRRRLQRLEALRDASRRHLGRLGAAHAGRQPDGPQRLRRRAGQEGEADPRLPDDHGPQLRRGPARRSTRCS